MEGKFYLKADIRRENRQMVNGEMGENAEDFKKTLKIHFNTRHSLPVIFPKLLVFPSPKR